MIGSIMRLASVRNGPMISTSRAFQVSNVLRSSRHISINIHITSEATSGTNVSINIPESISGKSAKIDSTGFVVDTSMSKQVVERLSSGPSMTLKALDTAEISDDVVTDLSRLITLVINSKTNNTIDCRQYRTLKMMGDSYLRTLTYQYLYEKGIRTNLVLKSDCILVNNADCAMPKFYDEYIKELHVEHLANEELSAHGKCDFVEALVEVARSESCTSPTLIFIISKLLDHYR